MYRLFVAGFFALSMAEGVSAQAVAPPPAGEEKKEPKAEAAKSERRSSPPKKKPGKVYTNADLQEGSSPSPPAASTPRRPSSSQAQGGRTRTDTGETPDSISEEATASESTKSIEAGDEAAWRSQAEQRRAAIRTAERRVQALQAQIDALAADLAPTNVMDPFRLQTIADQKAKAMKDLDAAREDLARARSSLAELEEEARRKGVPPGWLR